MDPSPPARDTRRSAIERWDGEGGAAAEPASPEAAPAGFDDAELVQMRMRVVALEGLVLALLVQASPPQRAAAERLADALLPHPGRTPHALTIRAAARIHQLVARARRLAARR